MGRGVQGEVLLHSPDSAIDVLFGDAADGEGEDEHSEGGLGVIAFPMPDDE